MTLFDAVLLLSEDHVKALQSHIVEAGLRKEAGNKDHKRYFKALRRKSKGKLRVCYAAICTSTDEEFDRVCARLVEGL
jgi:hypothetical protein